MTWRNCSSVSRVAGTAVADARVVDEDVDPAELAHRGVDERLAGGGVGHVGLHGERAAPGAPPRAPGCRPRRSTRRAPSATSAPASASAVAIGTPMPDEAPVTMATRPSSRKRSRTGWAQRRTCAKHRIDRAASVAPLGLHPERVVEEQLPGRLEVAGERPVGHLGVEPRRGRGVERAHAAAQRRACRASAARARRARARPRPRPPSARARRRSGARSAPRSSRATRSPTAPTSSATRRWRPASGPPPRPRVRCTRGSSRRSRPRVGRRAAA